MNHAGRGNEQKSSGAAKWQGTQVTVRAMRAKPMQPNAERTDPAEKNQFVALAFRVSSKEFLEFAGTATNLCAAFGRLAQW